MVDERAAAIAGGGRFRGEAALARCAEVRVEELAVRQSAVSFAH